MQRRQIVGAALVLLGGLIMVLTFPTIAGARSDADTQSWVDWAGVAMFSCIGVGFLLIALKPRGR